MRYSITSRFHGTLLGATLGEQINQSNIAKVIVPGVQSLVELGRFERESWLEKLLLPQLTPLQTIIATLPLALFYHDNKIKLRKNLLTVAGSEQKQLIIQQSILALGYAIAQALTEQLVPRKLIPQIVTYIDAPNTDLTDKLMQVQALLEQKAGIDKTINQITPNSDRLTISIALAFYYFLSTVEDFYLSVNRSRKSSWTSSAIVGALSGAYNSALNIPVSWQTPLVTSQPNAKTEMLQLSDSLFAVWSGAYDSKAKLISTAVAAPRVIRFR